MKQGILSLDQNKNSLNNREKTRLLRFFKNKEINHETQKYFYERGDQSTQENGAAKYINTTHDSLYEQYISKEESNILKQLNIKEELKNFDVIFDLGPGEGQMLEYVNSKSQIYRPVDVSAYVLDQIKKNKQSKIEGTINDWFNTNSFSEAKGSKSYILCKILPNLGDQEIKTLLKKLSPTIDGKSKLIMSYFPDFSENQENIEKLKAIYGDANERNSYYDKATHMKSAERIMGGFVSLGFTQENIKFVIEYDKANHCIKEGVEIIADTRIIVEGEIFTRKAGEKIMPCQSRRMTPAHIETMARAAGWKIKQHITGELVSAAVLEKVDPHKKQNSIKKRAQIGLLAVGLGATAVAGKVVHDQYQKDTFLEQKQQQIQENLLLSYTPEQITHFNEEIQQTVIILKTFYGIHDEGYINGLIRPYLLAHPELVQEIMERNGPDHMPTQSISDYLAMILMKNQENANFLEYFGDDTYDAYIPNMLQTLQYYDSIQEVNGSYDIKPDQEIIIPTTNYSQFSPNTAGGTKKEIGTGITRGGQQIKVFTVSYDPIMEGLPAYKGMIATTDIDRGPSDMSKTDAFIQNFLSYRHQTKYLAWQAALYVKQQIREKQSEEEKGREFEELTYIGDIEHILQEFVLHGGDTKVYLQGENTGQKVFEDIIAKNSKCTQYFKEQLLIDLETMEKLPGYESRRGKWAMQRGESNAYRNNLDYQKANKDFFKRD